MRHRQELPFLAGIAGVLRWAEELLIIASGPLLTLGLGIALVDLLTGGALLATQPWLLFVWAVAQAAGVDAQLVASAAKLAGAVHQQRRWAAVGYGVLIVPLAYVGFLASNVFATQQAEGLTTAEALARLGMDGTSWIVQRSALAVALVVLSGFLRYHPPEPAASAADERAQLERELTLEPLRAQLRARKALGWRDVAGAITRGVAATGPEADSTHAQDGAEPPARPPTGRGTPARHEAASAQLGASTGIPGLHALPARSRTRRPSKPPNRIANTRTASAEAKARNVWIAGMSVAELARGAKLSMSAASKWRKVLSAEASEDAQQEREDAEVAL